MAPTIDSFTASLDPVQVGNPVSLTGTFTDPGLNDTHTATFDWDDNTTTDYALINGEREITGTHTYTEAGVYTVTLAIEDDDGGSDSEVF
ncbi:MAG: PKD domain-containing protein [Halobacteriota archaeon]|nr:PKD domain-containing protein [Halobacteriota archaeon]